jgi:hypothetical protein
MIIAIVRVQVPPRVQMDEKPDNSSYRAFLFLKIPQPSSLERRLFLKTKKGRCAADSAFHLQNDSTGLANAVSNSRNLFYLKSLSTSSS